MSKVLVIKNADFSDDKIDTVTFIGGRKVIIDESNTTTDKYIAMQTGTPVDTLLSNWRTTNYIEINGHVLNGISNYFNNGTIITGMIVFYDENKNYISYSNDMTKVLDSSYEIKKGEFHVNIPNNAKYVRMSWEYRGGQVAGYDYDMDYPILYQL